MTSTALPSAEGIGGDGGPPIPAVPPREPVAWVRKVLSVGVIPLERSAMITAGISWDALKPFSRVATCVDSALVGRNEALSLD